MTEVPTAPTIQGGTTGDRLSRSLLDFARIMATFDRHNVSFVSVTQAFNTASSMGRLILNVLLRSTARCS